MLLNLSELDRGPVWMEQTVDVPAFAWEGGQQVRCGPVCLSGSMRRTRRGIAFAGRISTSVPLACTRCVGEFEQALEAKFHLILLPHAQPAQIRELEQADDECDAADLYPLEGEEVDLVALVREQIDLALPVRALCREDCRGLCPQCGADLNHEACRCAADGQEAASRLGEIREFRELIEQRKQSESTKGR
ncbi:MAG: DUF177 domain-containing protein [Acidobacteriota bacterium]|nr:MAG: DUF177 domain-containing protein [Acidobacteriota bacterium]